MKIPLYSEAIWEDRLQVPDHPSAIHSLHQLTVSLRSYSSYFNYFRDTDHLETHQNAKKLSNVSSVNVFSLRCYSGEES